MTPQLSIVPRQSEDELPLPPLLKWVGSKRRLASRIGSLARSALGQRGRYLEPFCGGGSVYFWLRPKNAVISDVLPELIGAYRAIVQSPWEVAEALQVLGQLPCTKEAYLAVRAEFNRARTPEATAHPVQAARLLYLNRRGFNGLWRQNRKGELNVPWGGERKEPLPSLEDILRASRALEPAQILHGDFEKVLTGAGKGDVIYADPPYAGTFTGYAGGFSDADQVRLARCLKNAAKRGAIIFASNSNHPLVIECYRSFLDKLEVEQYHAVGAKGDRRRKVRELLFTNALR